MLTEILVSLGLSTEEAEIYLSLLEKGPQGASGLAKNTRVKRTYVYRIASELIKKGLATVKKQGKTTVYEPQSPDHLLTQAQAQKQAALEAETALDGVLSNLKAKYKFVEAKPVITYYEGLEGIKKVYNDIIETGKNLLLFRSHHDESSPGLASLLTEQIKRQTEAGIHTRTITPLAKDTESTYLLEDAKHLVERHIVSSLDFRLPAQIIVYGTKVAIISLKLPIIITVIDNLEINATFRKLFDLDWNLTQAEHERLTKNWSKAKQV